MYSLLMIKSFAKMYYNQCQNSILLHFPTRTCDIDMYLTPEPKI